ncbi:MAG: bifunctional 5,10-methylenetetrahydrofolate dehydrogenase/5,10-methenyltetrahydrofolate cyclohydrolase [Clostridiales bacterium]|nr:bifunctional 5,10-methylenetetrahydrofolate dehydrogenase/5,10-methenyltetrahydrofolate cyclohydrolase [Clostridiales bacterium]
MSEILKGAPVAAQIRAKIAEKIEICRLKGVDPKVAIIRVGENPDDIAYEKRVKSNCEKVGLSYHVFVLDDDITQEDFEKGFADINGSADIDGILLFRPLPKHLDEEKICGMIDPKKDIDCMNPVNLNKVFNGDKDRFAPCTSEAVVEILKYYEVPIAGANAVVVNRSMVLGKPLAMLLLDENATVTVCHSKTADIKAHTKQADIVVTGVGKANFFGKEFFSEKNVVVDVGINFAEGRMTGDVDFEQAEPVVKAITPVPGGVGAVTSMILLKHAVEAAWRRVNG